MVYLQNRGSLGCYKNDIMKFLGKWEKLEKNHHERGETEKGKYDIYIY